MEPPLCTNGSAGYLMQLSVNPRPPEVFFVTRPPKVAGGLLQPPPWIFYIDTERLIPLYLLPVYYSYGLLYPLIPK